MTTTPPKTPTTTAEMIAHLSSETVFLEADALACRMSLDSAQEEYRRGQITLSELSEVQEAHSKAARALELHRKQVGALEAEQATQQDHGEIAALVEFLEEARPRLTEIETEALTRLQAAELALHEARLHARQAREEARGLRQVARHKFALLQAKLGNPSTNVTPPSQMTRQELQWTDATLAWWRLSDADVPERMDAPPVLGTVLDPDEARRDHAARWRSLNEAMARWPFVTVPKRR